MAGMTPLSSEQQADPLLHHHPSNAPHTTEAITESTPLLKNGASNPLKTQLTTTVRPSAIRSTRPTWDRATTMATPPTTKPSADISLSSVRYGRESTSAAPFAGITSATMEAQPLRPSLLRRVTDSVLAPLVSPWRPAQSDKEPPDPPTFWADHLHRQPLLKAWDNIPNPDVANLSIAKQVKIVEQSVVRQFGELGYGEVPLTAEWIRHILAEGFREPFGEPNVWQKLAVGAGPRGNWGPW